LLSDMCQQYWPPYHIEMHICIHISPHHISMHVSMHRQRAWDQTLGILFFWGDGTGVWTESVILVDRCSYHLRQSSSAFFLISYFQRGSGEQFCMCWLWTTILLIFVSWDLRNTRMRLWDWDLFGFFLSQRLSRNSIIFLWSWSLNSGVHDW
jgi:hypothetical protein